MTHANERNSATNDATIVIFSERGKKKKKKENNPKDRTDVARKISSLKGNLIAIFFLIFIAQTCKREIKSLELFLNIELYREKFSTVISLLVISISGLPIEISYSF